jgi:hypothetical protein
MKKIVFLLLLSLIVTSVHAQDKALQAKFDSIVKEADLLYAYEKVAWNASDLMVSDSHLRSNCGGYLVYHSNDTLFATFYNKLYEERIAKYYFTFANLEKPFLSETESAHFSVLEKDLLDIKLTILGQLSEKKFNVGVPEGYSPNFDMIKQKDGYRFYIIMGTSENGVIPFGNDYLFIADKEGNIDSWQKFHSRVIPAGCTGPNGEKVVSAIHSHLKTTPYITATDICTFRLYADMCGMKEFMVLSTANDEYYKYNIETNKITITKP